MDELYFANLAYPRIQELLDDERTTVLLFPVGSTEPHGPHSPLATDPIISIGICERVAQRLGDDPELRALILPTLPYAVTRYTAGFPGAVHVEEETLERMVVDVCSSLARQGFPHVVIVNNHFEPEHVQTLHRSLDRLDEQGIRAGYLDLTRKERAQRLTQEFRLGECHAGRYETSLVLAQYPHLVDRAAAAKLEYVPVSLPKVIAAGMKDFRDMGLPQAYCGAPAEATAEEGEEIYATLVEMTIEVVRALVAGSGGRDRSGLFGRV
ncbi:MAG TPA: creatininase family protein [Gaiellaceae bacterium]|nr:creatininase family protein [Gaiellaceae bacterium]